MESRGPYAGPVSTWADIHNAAIIGYAYKQNPLALLRQTRDEWDVLLECWTALQAHLKSKPRRTEGE